MKIHLVKKLVASLLLLSLSSIVHAEFSGNVGISNNYLWRGLTQSTDEPAISGGLDYAHESGFYVGTWASNVQYASDDAFSYEHDIYAGYAWAVGELAFDVGYLYYNYNEEADFDFGEIYGNVSWKGFTLAAWLFTHTQDEESNGVAVIGRDYDYGFGSTYYLALDYGFEIPNMEGWEIGLHGGLHDGDFVDGFNFAAGITSYIDWNASISRGGFSFMVSGTDLDSSDTAPSLNNDDLKWVVSYSVDF